MIADLHCDLLLYLDGENRTLSDRQARCSLPQLKEGGVKFQTLPLFSETGPGSSLAGERQFKIFENLPKEHFTIVKSPAFPEKTIGVMFAIENGSVFCAEEDDLNERLLWLEKLSQRPLYIGLTWNTENRFGGGAETSVGLKKDGEKLLDFLHQRGICVDLSHTSDALAMDILHYIDHRQLEIPVIASHSNFRAVEDVARNLPDFLAKEVIQRGGVIGLNFVNRFVGESSDRLLDHLEHIIALGGENQVCFGADFYFTGDLSPEYQRALSFFEDLGDAGTYPGLLRSWEERGVSKELIEKVCHKNLLTNCIAESARL